MSPLPPQPLSPLDGRYRQQVHELGEYLSEAGLNRARVRVEVEWVIYLTDHHMFGSERLTHEQARELRELASEFGEAEIKELAQLETETHHDVKAVEYLVRRKLNDLGLAHISELTHFACTSEDINNLSYALTIQSAVRDVWLPKLRSVISMLRERAVLYRADAMMSRTHGQPATPTTMGKEIAVFVYRLERVLTQIEQTEYLGKFSGATGTFAAHLVADPHSDWASISHEFVTSLAGRALPTHRPCRPDHAQPGHRYLDLHLVRIFSANPPSRCNRFLNNAPQNQPHTF
jgi:adenylosuccinate lyase